MQAQFFLSQCLYHEAFFSSSLTFSGLYYKPMTIVNDDSRVVTKLETSLSDKARVVIYDRHMFIVQATGQLS
jgi:hypothetical protein